MKLSIKRMIWRRLYRLYNRLPIQALLPAYAPAAQLITSIGPIQKNETDKKFKNMNFIVKIIALLLLCGLCNSLQAQTWVHTYNPVTMPIIPAGQIEPYGVDEYVVSDGITMPFRRLDRNGHMQPYGSSYSNWITDFKQTSDGGYIISAPASGVNVSPYAPSLTKLRSNGSIEWSQAYDSTTYGVDIGDVRLALDGGYVFWSHQQISRYGYDIRLTKVDAQGNPLWTQQYGDTLTQHAFDVCTTPDSGYWVAANQLVPSVRRELFLVRTDGAGNTLWTRTYPNLTNCNSMGLTADNGCVVSGSNSSDGFFAKIDQQGNVVWQTMVPNSSGGAGKIQQTVDGSYTGIIGGELIRLNSNGSIRWRQTPLPNNAANYVDWERAADGGYVLSGSISAPGPYVGYSMVVKTDSSGVVLLGTLDGTVFYDQNSDCLYSNSDDEQAGVVVQAVDNNGLAWYGTTDANGHYTINVPNGTYTVSSQLNYNNPYTTPCTGPATVVVNGVGQPVTTNFGYTIHTLCPYMTVAIEANILRRGIDSSAIYTVHYCNDGTADATNVSVEVLLDQHYVFQGSTLPIASQQGNTYTFNLGTVAQGVCQDFYLYGYIDTNAVLGQIHCAEAQIYPDSICIGITHPIIQTSTICQGPDTLLFLIQNLGSNMLMPQQYNVFEDHLMLRQGTFILDSLETDTIVVGTQNGSLYRIEAQQSIGARVDLSLDAFAWTFTSSCQGNITATNNAWISNFYTSDGQPSRSVSCRPNQGSSDPNDKTGYPLGYGTDHYILPDLPLTYKIRFQNTGTDTAFRVLILDTLSAHLDVTTLQLQTSSHPMTWRLYGNNVLEVLYDPIALPDSNVNEPASHGFVTFQIDPLPNLPLPTVVENTAAIYFDGNAPIITNTTSHTIDTGFVPIKVINSVEAPFENRVEVLVYPNPFYTQTVIEVKFSELDQAPLDLIIYNSLGQVVHQQKSEQQRFVVQRNGLTDGVYFYTIRQGALHLSTGQIVVGTR